METQSSSHIRIPISHVPLELLSEHPLPGEYGSLPKRSHTIAVIVLICIIVAVVVRLSLPFYVLRYVNEVLNRDPSYRGEVREVSLRLYRGAYRIEDVKIWKKNGAVPVPLFFAEGVDLSVEWRELFHGALVGEVELEKPELNFVHGETKADTQTGSGNDWAQTVRDLFPMRINRLSIVEGRIHYRDFSSTPKVDVSLSAVNGDIHNLTNSEKVSKSLVAKADVSALAENEAPVRLRLDLDPFAKSSTFDSKFELQGLKATRLNDLFRAYANVDSEGGTVSLFSELHARNGQLDGYLKPLIEDLQLLRWKTDAGNPLRIAWETIVSGIAEVFTNLHTKKIATVIPVSGRIDDPEQGGWSAFVGILKNAFIHGLKPGWDEAAKKAPAK